MTVATDQPMAEAEATDQPMAEVAAVNVVVVRVARALILHVAHTVDSLYR